MTSEPKTWPDAIANIVWTLYGHNATDLFERLAHLPLGASLPATITAPTPDHDEAIFAQLRSFGRPQTSPGAAPRGIYDPTRGSWNNRHGPR